MPVVCGSDLSSGAVPAIRTAAHFASLLGDAELWLVHVIDPALGLLNEEYHQYLKDSARRRLESEVESLKVESILRVQIAVLTGVPAKELLTFAEEKKAELLVIASQGHGSESVLRVGGTSERVAQAAQIPVLVVRDAAPFEAWGRGERSLRVLLGADWTASTEAAIRWVKLLRQLRTCDVAVGHIYYPDFTGTRPGYGLPPEHSWEQPDPEKERLLTRDLATRVGELGGTGEVAFIPKLGMGRLGDHLVELSERERSDLIVLGSHHKRGLARLGSVLSVVLRYSHAAVASIPLPQGERLLPEATPILRRVLVVTDLSSFSDFAIPYAYALLPRTEGEVFLLHVLGRKDPAQESEVIARLRALVPRQAPGGAVTRVEVVRHSDPAVAICEAAERLGADAACMASHGRGGLDRAVLGSVAEAVMRKIRCPLFLIKPLPA